MEYVMLKFFLFLFISFSCAASGFKMEAKQQANMLKKELLSQVKSKMAEGGPLHAVEFCHENALELTEEASKKGYNVGRTSLKYRNPKNAPQEWIRDFLKQAQSTTAKNPYAAKVVHNSKGENVYITPLYTAAACLTCHGSPSGALKNKLEKLYPDDKALGYSLGEFRGFVWVKKNERGLK